MPSDVIYLLLLDTEQKNFLGSIEYFCAFKINGPNDDSAKNLISLPRRIWIRVRLKGGPDRIN